MRELEARLMAAGMRVRRSRRKVITRPVVFVVGILVGFVLARIAMLVNPI